MYNHYIIVEKGIVTEGWSSGPNPEKKSDIAITLTREGTYQFRLAADGDQNPPLFTRDGIPLYRWDGSQVIPRTEAEIQADREALPPPPPTQQEKAHLLEQQVQALSEQNTFLEECIAEMAGVVYA